MLISSRLPKPNCIEPGSCTENFICSLKDSWLPQGHIVGSSVTFLPCPAQGMHKSSLALALLSPLHPLLAEAQGCSFQTGNMCPAGQPEAACVGFQKRQALASPRCLLLRRVRQPPPQPPRRAVWSSQHTAMRGHISREQSWVAEGGGTALRGPEAPRPGAG